MLKKIIVCAFALVLISCQSSTKVENYDKPPDWSKNAMWYQIFVERFHNGDPSNDPTIASISTPTESFPVPETWEITPWGWDWYKQEPWAKNTGRELRETLQHRRYGGDLQGVMDKLDYLVELGITAIYFNPLNDAPSLHKFDARNYHHIDINFGPDPEGDLQIIASEDPADPSTWKWTSADKLFLELVQELHKRDIRVIVDFSWNHTGALFWAWKDILENQENSRYSDWYDIISFDDPNTPENEFDYKGWLNIKSLPEFKKVDVPVKQVHGMPFEGNLHPEVKEYVFEITRRWLAPDGDVSKGIDGFRLDVAEQIPLGFWRDYRQFVKSINPEAYLVGEIWWSNWPDDFMDPTPYTSGDIFDAIMFYHAYRPARSFFTKSENSIDAATFADSLEFEWGRLLETYPYAMMNLNASHDTPRLLTCFANPGKYKYRANPYEDPGYMTSRPDQETYQRARLYLIHQFTSIGAPHIWNGDEMGMWGSDDPDCRKPLWWQEFEYESETLTNIQPGSQEFDQVGFNHDHFNFYKTLVQLRKSNPVLVHGKLDFLLTEGKKLMYKRFDDNEAVYVLINLEDETAVFDIPETSGLKDLINNNLLQTQQVSLEPLSAMVLRPN